MIYFISDTHFGHYNIIRLCNRPFSSLEEMNETLIENWNRKVTNRDTIYILGDLFFRATEVTPILERLKGQKHLIVGNHDSSWMKDVDLNRYFKRVELMMELHDGKRQMTLCHYPMLSWRADQKTYMLYGHIHNNIQDDYWPLILRRPRMLNASVEVNNYEPVTFDELVENNTVFKHSVADGLGVAF